MLLHFIQAYWTKYTHGQPRKSRSRPANKCPSRLPFMLIMLPLKLRRLRFLVVFVAFIFGSIYLIFFLIFNVSRYQLPFLIKNSRASSVAVAFPEAMQIKLMENQKPAKKHNENNLTPLGAWLLSKDNDTPPQLASNRTKPFLILIWQHGPFLERRHLRRFSENKKFSAWESCTVNNCKLSYEPKDLDKADAVVFHLHRTRSVKSLPHRNNSKQRWIFLSDESPFHTFLYGSQNISDYNGLFNWSMTYRVDSDVPVPYGRTIIVSNSTLSNQRAQDLLMKKLRVANKLVAILGSNCSGKNNRWNYVKKLKMILGDRLDILGHCLNGNRTACLGHFNVDCPALSKYKFYLAFENSNCREYLTEKVFWNAYEKFAVPVIMGAPRSDCQRLLPPSSYLHVDDFVNPSSLADYLLYLERNQQEYYKFHAWRSSYRILNEHGYFGSASRHYCRICQALHYNSPLPKVYERLQDFINFQRDCDSSSR